MNEQSMRDELDLVEEIRPGAALYETRLKQQITLCHDTKVIKREFEVGTLVLSSSMKDLREEKLAPNWEGPYRVRGKMGNKAY